MHAFELYSTVNMWIFPFFLHSKSCIRQGFILLWNCICGVGADRKHQTRCNNQTRLCYGESCFHGCMSGNVRIPLFFSLIDTWWEIVLWKTWTMEKPKYHSGLSLTLFLNIMTSHTIISWIPALFCDKYKKYFWTFFLFEFTKRIPCKPNTLIYSYINYVWNLLFPATSYTTTIEISAFLDSELLWYML